MKTCLLVGGGGFIGRAVARQLLRDGERRVLILGRSQFSQTVLPEGVEYVCLPENGRPEFLTALLSACNEVIDFAYASVPKTSFEDPVQDVLGNLPFSVELLRLASKAELERFVFISSGGTVYGNPLNLPIDESHPTNPVSPYGITKLALEKYGCMYQRLAGLPFIVIRPGNPYGPEQLGGGAQGFIATAIRCIREGRAVTVFGERGTVRDYIYIDDLAKAVVAALRHGKVGGVYNAGTCAGLDNVQVLQLLTPLAEKEGLSIQLAQKPSRPFDVEANVLSSARLRYETGWQPSIDVEAGFAMTWSASG
jgi:UDP-glucose 4-epimerase